MLFGLGGLVFGENEYRQGTMQTGSTVPSPKSNEAVAVARKPDARRLSESGVCTEATMTVVSDERQQWRSSC
ncbi:hypothetical protein RRF57_000328 [Xylaria bambusicola]|uniref:Uncharacterized protein n=1 Tax=Xylaria bambusicola TaxID=326684 RepID=A0AAN7UBY6_9PEZI